MQLVHAARSLTSPSLCEHSHLQWWEGYIRNSMANSTSPALGPAGQKPYYPCMQPRLSLSARPRSAPVCVFPLAELNPLTSHPQRRLSSPPARSTMTSSNHTFPHHHHRRNGKQPHPCGLRFRMRTRLPSLCIRRHRRSSKSRRIFSTSNSTISTRHRQRTDRPSHLTRILRHSGRASAAASPIHMPRHRYQLCIRKRKRSRSR